MIEIERKFLVNSEAFKTVAKRQYHIIQGFLNTDPERTVRVRIRDLEGFITVKGKPEADSISRFEWEMKVAAADAEALLELCHKPLMEKTRYIVPIGKHTFEVDDFHGDNQGLLLAEVELKTEYDRFDKPDWLGMEVTGDIRYYNSQLSKNPYKNWSK